MTALAEEQELQSHHERLIRESAISEDVARARGYWTATKRAEMTDLGFADYQCRTPALVIPVYDVHGELAMYQARPDSPRKKGGKPLKYETPSGCRMVVDVPPPVRESMGDPSVPLWITEGARKADSAVSHGLCCVALLGVWNWKGKNSFGASTALPCWDSIALKGRSVVIAFDSDVVQKESVQTAMRRLTGFLDSRGATVTWCIIPVDPTQPDDKLGLDDFLAAGGNVEQLKGFCREPERRRGPIRRSDLPMVEVNGRQVREIAEDIQKAIGEANDPPHIFTRSGFPVRVRHDESGRPRVDALGEGDMLYAAAQAADYYRVGKDGDYFEAPPPKDAIKVAMADPGVQFPPLVGITQSPIIAPSGAITTDPGYDARSRLYYSPPPGFSMDSISPSPERSEVVQAGSALYDLGVDFGFTDEADRVNFVGCMVSLVLRPLIEGPIPLILITAPQAGSGKTLLARILGILATGHEPDLAVAPEDDAAWRKFITSSLTVGSEIVVIDNVESSLWAPSFAAVLTSSKWTDRILGRSEMISLPNRAAWVATGNNVQLRGDLARRTVEIRIDAKHSRPWQRGGFLYDDIARHVLEHRGELVHGVLTMARAWVREGCPGPGPDVPKLGGFERWRHVVGGILGTVGLEGFLGNTERVYSMLDEESTQWSNFLAAIDEAWGEQRWTINVLTKAIKGGELTQLEPVAREALGDMIDNPRKVGRAFAAREDRRYSLEGGHEVWLERVGTYKRAIQWRVNCNADR